MRRTRRRFRRQNALSDERKSPKTARKDEPVRYDARDVQHVHKELEDELAMLRVGRDAIVTRDWRFLNLGGRNVDASAPRARLNQGATSQNAQLHESTRDVTTERNVTYA